MTSGYAKQLWQASGRITGTPAETYLREVRKIEDILPPTLCYNPCTWHGPSRRDLPALTVRIDGGAGFAVLRTYLAPDGPGKADLPHHKQKMMLGKAADGHLSLQSRPGPLVAAEGIETALSLPGLLDIIADATLWAALTAANLRAQPAGGARSSGGRDGWRRARGHGQ